VDAWAQAAQAYSDDFRNCGTRAYPTRDFFSACTKKTRHTFRRAKDAVLRAIKRSKKPACKRVRERLSAVMARTGAALERTVLAFDRSNNATLEHRSYSGPPPQQLYLRAAQELQTGAPEAKGLSREIDAGC
jgi:hypothetical protein